MTTVELLSLGACLALGYKVTHVMVARARSGEPRPPPRLRFDMPLPWHEVLGVSRDATLEQIAAAYKHRLAQCDTTRLSSLEGQLRLQAQKRAHEIHSAYQQARVFRQRKW